MIDSFTEQNRFLSNFYPSEVKAHFGLSYPTVEHAYQASKSENSMTQWFVKNATSPGIAKKIGRQIILRPDWEEVKLPIMKELLVQKFSKDPLRQMLLDTGNEELVEGNYWGDTFWGVCRGVGENHLGKLLMEIRDDISNRTKE